MRQKTHLSRITFRHQLLGLFGLLLLLSTGFSVFHPNHQATALTSNYINFQARLMNASGAIAPDGNYNVEFKIYNALTSSGSSQGSCTGDAACLWTETRVSTDQVHVVNGYLTVNLGSVTALPAINWDQRLYMTMNIGGTGSPTWDGEMAPRLQLTAVPYAFRAGTLGAVSGANSTVLDTGTPSGANLLHLPAESGTLCVQAATTCGFVVGTSGSYIQNAPAGQQTGNYNIVAGAAGTTAALIQGAASGTAPVAIIRGGNTPGVGQDLLDLQTWNGTTATTVFGVSNVGDLAVQNVSVAAGKSISFVSGAGNFDQSGSTGTFATGSGAVSLKGDTAITAGKTLTVAGNTSFNVGNTLGITVTSDLSAGARSTPALLITQANDATNSNTSNLLKIQNSDSSSTAAALQISNTSAGKSINISGTTTGTVIDISGSNLTTGTGFSTDGSTLTSGSLISLGGANAGATAGFTGSLLGASTTRTLTSGSITDSGNFLNFNRANTVNNAGSTFTMSGAVATLQSNCTQTAGTCTDTSNILNLSQLYANASGTVLNVSGAGTGNLATLDATNASSNGVRVDVQSSSSSQYVLNLTANNSATNILYARADGNVGIGTAAPTRPLDIAVNNSTVTALPLLIEQAGTGDAGIELKTTSRNYYLGVDNTDGVFKISSLGAASGTFTTGNTTIESGSDSNVNGTTAYKITTGGTGGTVSSISVYIKTLDATNKNIQLSLYADSSGVPGALMGSSSIVIATANSWNTLAVSGVTVSASTSYWISISENGSTQWAEALAGGTTAYRLTGGYPAPNPFSQDAGQLTHKMSAYMTVAPTGTPDAFGGTPLFRMTDTGATAFQNSADSTAAFVVQNAAGVNFISTDTTNTTLNLGVTGATATASTVNVATSTGATQTINVGSSTTGSAANGTVVLIQGGNTSSGSGAVSIQTLAAGLLNIGSNNAANTIQIGSTTLSSGTQTIQIGNNNTAGGTTNVTIGTGTTATAGTTALQAKTAVTIATNGIGRAVFDTSNNLFLGNANTSGLAAAPNAFTVSATNSNAATVAGAALTIQSGSGNTTGAGGLTTIQGGASGAGAAAAGGGVTIQGGSATGTGASNGGEVKLQGGTSTNGTKGLIQLNGGTYFTTVAYSSGSSATITQASIDSNSAILATATAAGLTFTVPSPTIATAGRVLYVTNAGGTNAFTLAGAGSSFTLNTGSTATLLWNGSAWTSAGVDASTLQNVYNNSGGGNTPEILLDVTRSSLDIQDSNAGLGATVPLLAVRASATATTLGAALFTVENSSGSPLVGIGTQTQTRTLDIAINNATTTAPALLIEQAGAGDASQEYKSTTGSFFTGIDTSDSGKFKINSSVATGSSSQIGRTTIGGTTDGGDINTQNASKFTLGGTSGTLTSISAYVAGGSSSNLYSVAIYADSAGSPGAFIASSSNTTIVPNAWNTATISAALSASTSYWLAFNTNDGAANMKFDATGTSCFNSRTFASGWTAPFGGCSSGTQNFSIYGTYNISGSLDSFGASSLFSLTSTGQAAFQNFSNSTTAFQVLNTSATALLGVDTSTPTVSLGVTGATATASTVNVATSTGATQTVNIGSATSGSASANTVVLVQGGSINTGNGAVSIQTLASGLLNIGSNNAANTIQIGSTTLSSGTQTIQIGNNNTSGGTTNITIGNGTSATAGTTALQAKTSVTVATNGVTRATFDNTNTMYLGNGVTNAAPNDFVVQGTGSGTATVAGGKLTVIGGTGNTTGAGGAVTVQGGASAGAGAGGAVTIQGGTANATAGSNGGAVTITSGSGSATGTGGVGANILLNAGSAGGSGNNAGGNITAVLGAATGTGAQGTFQVQNALGASLLTIDPSNTAASLNLISNGGAETGSPPTGWAVQGAGSSVATGTGTDAASGAQSAKVTFGTTANSGTKASFTTAPTASTTVNYIVSFSAKLVSGTAISSTLQVLYSPDNGTTTPQCTNYSTQGLSTTAWTKVTCTFVPGSTTVTTALLIIRQSDAPGVSRVIDIDNLSVVQQNSAATTNVGDLKVGGAQSQGLTLLTLDTYAATPFSGSNSSLAGSMYFDTSQGKIQCYDGTNWGACGAAPNSIVTLSPEFAGAVLHGTVGTAGGTDNNIGTLTSDFCSDFLDINDATHGTSICGTNETFNFYRWTSPQSNAQTYDVYITYQLPSTFKNFVSGQTNMLGRTDSANSTVTYSVYKNVSGTGLSLCSAAKTISTGVQTSWQTATPTTDLSTCSFAANNSVVVKVEVTSSSNANAYIGTLNFQYSNQ